MLDSRHVYHPGESNQPKRAKPNAPKMAQQQLTHGTPNEQWELARRMALVDLDQALALLNQSSHRQSVEIRFFTTRTFRYLMMLEHARGFEPDCAVKSLECLDTILETDPNYVDGYIEKAYLAIMHSQDFQAARAAIEQVLQRAPSRMSTGNRYTFMFSFTQVLTFHRWWWWWDSHSRGHSTAPRVTAIQPSASADWRAS